MIVNAGAIDLYGLEWKGNLQVTPHLVLQTAAAINDSNVKDYSVCSDCQNITGATAATGHIPGAPKYTWTASAATVPVDDAFRDRQTQAGSLDHEFIGRLGAEETLKYLFVL